MPEATHDHSAVTLVPETEACAVAGHSRLLKLAAQMAAEEDRRRALAAPFSPRADLPPVVETEVCAIWRRQEAILAEMAAQPGAAVAGAHALASAIAIIWPEGEPVPDAAAPALRALLRHTMALQGGAAAAA